MKNHPSESVATCSHLSTPTTSGLVPRRLGFSDKSIIIHWTPDVGLLLVRQLNAIWVAFIPQAQDLASLPLALPHNGLHFITHLETELTLHLAGLNTDRALSSDPPT